MQIGIEKERLIKEGKIRKEKPLPKITEEETPFEIPESWAWVRLGNCISLLSGQDMTPDKYNDGGVGIPYLTGASNIEDGKIIINRWTDEPKSIAIKGNLLITCKGTIGVTCILTEKKVHIARQIMAITAICNEIEYINKFIQLYVGVLKNKAKSMIPGIERKDILNAMVPLLPLDEEKRIVEKIEELLPYIEKYGKANCKLEKLDKSFHEDIQKSIDYFESKMRGFEVLAGDIIVSCAGTIGETYIIPPDCEQGIINQALMRIRLMPSVNVEYFLLYFDFILKDIARKSSKGSAIKNIPPFEKLKNYLVAFPPYGEQERIVKRLSSIVPYIQKINRKEG